MSFFLSPLSTMQFEDANGVPYSGAKLFCYAAGTTTKQATYQSANGSANTNPIVLDANGRPPYGIWTPAGDAYHYFLATSTDTDPPAGAALYEIDDVLSINDTSATDTGSGEWIDSTFTPTYLSGTSFSVLGDKLSIFTVGRRLKITDSGGTVYQTVASATYGSSVTTINLVSTGDAIDSGISAVFYGIISTDYLSDKSSLPAIRTPRYLVATTPNNTDYTLTELSSSASYKVVSYEDGMIVDVYISASVNNTGAVTFNINSLGAIAVVDALGNPLTEGMLQAGYSVRATYVSSANKFYLIETVSPSLLFGAVANGARNAINYAPVDSTTGLTALGGSTGSTTVTTTAISATDPLVVNASNILYNGAMLDEIGYSASNLSWTGLSTNGTMYLYVDIAEKTKALTTGSTTLAPVYQYAGTPSVTSGQATYSTCNNRMYVGNGSAAVQARRVFVGEVTVAGGVVTVITWYSINRRSQPAVQNYTSNTNLTFTHNLGVIPRNVQPYAICTVTDLSYAVGDVIMLSAESVIDSSSFTTGIGIQSKINTVILRTGSSGVRVIDATGRTSSTISNSKWNFGIIVEAE